LLCLVPAPADAWQVATNLTLKADLSFKEGYDSNVYLQDHEPDLTAVPEAVRPFQDSFITSLTPRLTFDWRPGQAFTAALSYAPEVAFYHSESSEDHVAHRGAINLGGKLGEVPWEMPNSLTFIDGSRKGLHYGVSTVPGQLDGVPAIGGIPVRDRREQFIYRGGLKATWSTGKLFLRPVLTAYLHDFQTVQETNFVKALPNGDPHPGYGYENYVDRNAMDFGLDVGWSVTPQTKLYVGYRYGYETEGEMVGSPFHYDSEINRPLAGIEGKPTKWLSANFSLGPDIHHTVSHYDPRFEPNYTTLWVDAVVTLLPTARDSVVLTWKQNTQPAFSSPSVYEDTVYDGVVRHRFDHHWSASAGFRGYLGDWQSPVKRRDWIYTASASVTYTLDQHFSADLTYAHDWAESSVPNTPGREFTRHLGWLALKYSF